MLGRGGERLDPLPRAPDQRKRRAELRGDVGAQLRGDRREVGYDSRGRLLFACR